MKDERIIIHVELTVQPKYTPEVKAVAKASWLETIKEPGCEYFMQTENKDDPNTLIFFEVFTSKATHESHLQTDHAKRFFTAIDGRLSKEPVMVFLKAL